MTQAKIGLVPLFSVTFALLAFFIGYTIAVAENHVDAWLPFISDCGAQPPESGVFGQLLNISAVFLAMMIYLIHRYTILFYTVVCEKDIGDWKVFSLLLMLLGWVATLGMSMVANFQEGPILLPVHNTGAFTFFIGIIIYFWGQIIIAYSLKPRMVSIHLTNIRLIITLMASCLLIFHMVCLFAQPFAKSAGKLQINEYGIARVLPDDPHFSNHLATTISEWILALLIELQILLYIYDLTSISLCSPQMSVLENDISKHRQLTSQTDQIYHAHDMKPRSDCRSTDAFLGINTQRRLHRVDHPCNVMNRVQPSSPPTITRAQETLPRANLVSQNSYNQYQYY